MDPSKAMERFALLSLITIRMPQCDEWRQEIIDFHLQFSRLLIEEELYEKTVDSLDDLKEYLQFDTYHDEVSGLIFFKLHHACHIKIYKYISH